MIAAMSRDLRLAVRELLKQHPASVFDPERA
jgi:hypothetical protein